MNVPAVAAIVLLPAAAQWGARRHPVLRALGPVVLCYVAGVALSLTGLAPDPAAGKALSGAGVALAIPLLLLPTDFAAWLRSSRPAVVSFSLACAAVMACAWTAGRLFSSVHDSRALAGMLAGVYIGGTPNMSALAVALHASDGTFLAANAVDMTLSSAYLLFLTGPGRSVLRRFLPAHPGEPEWSGDSARDELSEFLSWPLPRRARAALVCLGAAGAALAVSAAVSRAATGTLSDTAVILLLTSLGVAGSLWGPTRRMPGSFVVGNYLLLVFCAAVGAMTRLDALAGAGWGLPAMVAFTITSSILVHYGAAAALGLDAETVMVTSCAAIMSPAFVVVVVAALKDRRLLLPGVTSGLVGYAVANYLGWLVWRLL